MMNHASAANFRNAINFGLLTALFLLADQARAAQTVRGLLEALGVTGPIRSPSYTLIESYPAGGRRLHHLDWYRLAGADDLEGLGFRELLGPGHWVLVEWPERAPTVAAQADLALGLAYEGAGRRLEARAATPRGAEVLRRWIQRNA